MRAWTGTELDRIGRTREPQLESLRPDDTLRAPVAIWFVRDGDGLYSVVKGREGSRLQGTLTCHQGRIRAGGVTEGVTFQETDSAEALERIDAVCRSKYSHCPSIAEDCAAPRARYATIQLAPR